METDRRGQQLLGPSYKCEGLIGGERTIIAAVWTGGQYTWARDPPEAATAILY